AGLAAPLAAACVRGDRSGGDRDPLRRCAAARRDGLCRVVACTVLGCCAGSRRLALAAAGVFEVLGVAAVARWAPVGAVLPGVVLITGTATAAVMIGVNLQTRRAYLAALEERAARLEDE